jgi:hypothetical protein
MLMTSVNHTGSSAFLICAKVIRWIPATVKRPDEAYAFMKDSDAIIFMLSVDSPINEIAREFLVEARNYAAKC